MYPERVANTFAADLLMPKYLFAPIAGAYRKLNFKTVGEIARVFRTSLTATAIRLVDWGHVPRCSCVIQVQAGNGSSRGPDVSSRWFPRDNLDADSFAFGILHGGWPDDTVPRRIGAEAWFDRWEAQKYEVHEQTVRTGKRRGADARFDY